MKIRDANLLTFEQFVNEGFWGDVKQAWGQGKQEAQMSILMNKWKKVRGDKINEPIDSEEFFDFLKKAAYLDDEQVERAKTYAQQAQKQEPAQQQEQPAQQQPAQQQPKKSFTPPWQQQPKQPAKKSFTPPWQK